MATAKKQYNGEDLINLNYSKLTDKNKIEDFIGELEKDNDLIEVLNYNKLDIKNNIQFENFLNLLDKSNRLLSFFAYIPDLDANGVPLIIGGKVLNNLSIPKTDEKGNFYYVTNPNNGLKVKDFKDIDSFVIPPLRDIGNAASSEPMHQPGKGSNNLNPTRFYDLKSQIRAQAKTKVKPIVEYAYIKVQDYRKAEYDSEDNLILPEVQSVTIIVQIEWDSYFKRIAVSPSNYGVFQGQLQNSGFDWTVSSLKAAKVANKLEQISQMEDIVKRDNLLEQIEAFATLKQEENSK